ncbi:hypothetical protein E8E12_000776 [Didymella heteroderae]|uniref:Cytochrome P450 n=1 Tax=Didymella heteroderae TaxID=1769908 RepID=A0A9P5BUE6_9PLEO|nr:hypothetical protein E8E12_000776 [Didymella heteroderae]
MAAYWLSLTIAFIGFVALKCLYNIYLHPLRSYPGPLIARASFLPYQCNLLRGRPHLWIQDLHKRYGRIVRLSPNELSFIQPEVWKDVYGHRASAFTKSYTFYGPDAYGNPPGILRADNVSHARQRKTVSHAFSDKALKDQEELLKGHVSLLIEKLKGVAAGQLRTNIVEWYNFTTFDIMADLTFGESLHQLTDSAYHPWVWAIFSHMKMIALYRVCREWPGITQLLRTMLPKDAKEKQRQHLNFSVSLLDKRMACKPERPDIWSFVTRDTGQEGALLPTELHSNGALFMLAGTETTATELSGLTFILLKHPDKLRRLTDEVRSAFPSAVDLSMSSLSRLEYLGACIEEGLRLYPPVPVGPARTVPQGGANVCGNWVPGGTTA